MVLAGQIGQIGQLVATLSIEDSSSIKTVNSRRGCFGCFYCTECHSSDQERTIHIDNAHPRKLHYPTPKDFENRLRPNK
jgi:hypothetical protein